MSSEAPNVGVPGRPPPRTFTRNKGPGKSSAEDDSNKPTPTTTSAAPSTPSARPAPVPVSAESAALIGDATTKIISDSIDQLDSERLLRAIFWELFTAKYPKLDDRKKRVKAAMIESRDNPAAVPAIEFVLNLGPGHWQASIDDFLGTSLETQKLRVQALSTNPQSYWDNPRDDRGTSGVEPGYFPRRFHMAANANFS